MRDNGISFSGTERFLLNEKAPTHKNRGQQLNDKMLLHSAEIVFLSKPTFQVLDIWKSLFLIAGVDVMLNFTLLFIVTPIEKEDSKFRCQMVLYSILLMIIVSAVSGSFIGFSVSILVVGTMPILLGLFLLSSFIRKAEKEKDKTMSSKETPPQ